MALSRLYDDLRAPAAIQIEALFAIPPATHRWLGTLPSDVRPLNLLRQFPQLANALATRWPSKLACRTVLYAVTAQPARAEEQVGSDITRESQTLLSYLEKL